MQHNELGFGLMRLPRLEDGSFDVEQIKQMVDMFMAAGLTYFDTAYAYEGSEEVTKTALVDRYPRESFTLATKMCVWKDQEGGAGVKRELETSLARTGAGYFDYYLLHAVQTNNIARYDEYGIWDYVRMQKEKGLIRHYGFSFHSDPETLDKLLTLHPDVDFVQLQINYADWDSPSVQSRRNYEVARAHGKPIVIMEPVKGGVLANPPSHVKSLLLSAHPELSCASWAIRYAASLPGVIAVLSGMSDIAQMQDNLSYMKDFHPLDEQEQHVILSAQAALASIPSIPCTGCSYCTDGCPMKIKIPSIFAARNDQLLYERMEQGQADYVRATKSGSRASDCIACGQCERVCPQHINVIKRLQECAKAFE